MRNQTYSMTEISDLLSSAWIVRKNFIEGTHDSAFRLFNGFLEGFPSICVDIFGCTALIHNYNGTDDHRVSSIHDWIIENLQWIRCIIMKTRTAQTSREKRGTIIHGTTPDDKVCENGVWYTIDLTMNQDTSFYLDTRNLRKWAFDNLAGKTVLNSFAYTGSLGIAATAGGAERVIHLDRNRSFLNLAEKSCTLNNFTVKKQDFLADDFFTAISGFKRSGQMFDCVFLDPPFFSTTPKGKVDLETGSNRLINKIRPLIKHDGWLVAINNAIFLSGKDYLTSLETLCESGYLHIEHLIPVPDDFIGSDQTRSRDPLINPAPFNHSTKIALLRVKRKSEEKMKD